MTTKDYQKPAFDPNKEFEPIEDNKPSFDPNKSFEVVDGGAKKKEDSKPLLGGLQQVASIVGPKVPASGTLSISKKDKDTLIDFMSADKTPSLPAYVSGNITAVPKPKPVKSLTKPQIEEEAVRRLGSPLKYYQQTQQPQMASVADNDDPVGGMIGRLEQDENIALSNTSIEQLSDKEFMDELSINHKQREIIKQYAIPNGKEGKNILQRIISNQSGFEIPDLDGIPIEEIEKQVPKTLTGKLAFEKYLKRRLIDDEFSKGTPLEEMAVKLYSGGVLSQMPEAKAGAEVDAFLNDPEVIDKVSESQELTSTYQKAKYDLHKKFPSYGLKKVTELISQEREDKGMNSWFMNNPSLKNTDELVSEMKKEGKLSFDDIEIYNKNIRPIIEAGYGDAVIKTPDLIHSFGEGLKEAGEDIASSVRDIINKGTFGVFKKTGLLENDDSRAARLIQEDYAKPEITPKSFGTQSASSVGHFTGFAAPMILGAYAKVPGLLTNVLMFEGANADQALVLFPKNKLKQNLYTLLGTTIDISLAKLIPTEKAAQGLSKVFRKDLVGIVNKLSNKEISEEVAKQTVLTKIKDYAISLGKHNVQTANVLTAFNLAHNGLDAAFGKRDFNLEEQAKEAIDNYKTNFLSGTLISAMAAKGSPTKLNGNVLREMADNPEKYRGLIEIELTKNPELSEQSKESLSNLDHLVKVNEVLKGKEGMNDRQRSEFLALSLREKVLTENVKAIPDKGLKADVEKEMKMIEIEKEKVLDPDMSNTEFVKEMYENDLLGKGSIDMLSNENGKFDETKVGAYLKEVAQRANNLDAEGNLNTFGDTRKAAAESYPEQIIEVANERWPEYKKKGEEQGEFTKAIAEEKSNVSVILPEENKPTGGTITIENKEYFPEPKTKGAAIILPKPNEQIIKEGEQSATEGTQQAQTPEAGVTTETTIQGAAGEGGKEPPKVGDIPITTAGSAAEGITQAANAVRREERRLPEFEREPQTFEQWNSEAEKLLKEGYDAEALLDKIEKGHDPTPTENAVRKMYIATLDAEIAKNPTDALLAKQKRFIEIGDAANRRAGQNLVSLKGAGSPMNSISDFYVAKMESAGVDKLTDQQKAEVKQQWDKVQKANEEAEAKLKLFEEENSKLKAENEILRQKKNKPPVERKQKKTDSDYAAERKSALEGAREALKKLRTGESGLSAVPLPGVRELIAIAPHVKKAVQSLVEQGIDKLEVVVGKVYDEFKEVLDGLSEKNIHDIIAGEYNEKKPTRSELADKMRDLKDEAYYINKLEKLLSGEEPKNEKKKVERNQQIKELQQKIKEFKKEQADAAKPPKEEKDADLTKLQALKKRNETEADKIRERIKTGDFEKEPRVPFLENKELQKKYPQQYKEVLDAIIKKEEAQHEFDIALMKDQLAKRTTLKKGIDLGAAIISTSKAVVTGIDASGVGIQNLLAMVAHPRSAIRIEKSDKFPYIKSVGALPGSVADFISEKTQQRWLAAVHNSELYPLAQKAGLDITEPSSLRAEKKEEIFSNNLLDKTIKFRGKEYKISKYTTKPFERIFTGLGNRLRWNLFERGVEKLQEEGLTWESHPEEFKSLAKILNTETGRGTLHPQVEKAYGLISTGIWSPRLMASRLNLLGLGDLGNALAGGHKGFYGGLTPRMRTYAIGNFAKFVTFGGAFLGLAGLTFADDVELDPREASFGSMLVNGKRYNIWGGFTQYVRYAVAMSLGGSKAGGEWRSSNQLNTSLRFLWSKTTPATGLAVSLLKGRDYMGKPVTFGGAVETLGVPLSIRGITGGIQKEGFGSILWTGMPSFLGINVSYESDFDDVSKEDKEDPTFKYFIDKGVKLPSTNTKTIEVEDADTNTIKKLSDYDQKEIEGFLSARKKYLKEELQSLKDGDITLYVDKFGRISTTNDDKAKEKEEIDLDKLTQEQWKSVMGIIGGKATKAAKAEIFGED
jgi:hypothetical protein